MIQTFVRGDGGGLQRLEGLPPADATDATDTTVWIDLVGATPEEMAAVSKRYGVNIQSRAEVSLIETSSRLVVTPDSLRVSYNSLGREGSYQVSAVTCIITDSHIITDRSPDTTGFSAAIRKLTRRDVPVPNCGTVLFTILDATVDRLADRLEDIGEGVDVLVNDIFGQEESATHSGRRARDLLNSLGVRGSQITKVEDCLVSLRRLSFFLQAHAPGPPDPTGGGTEADTLSKDVHSLLEYAEALDGKVDFLLDAMLGLINLDQNDVMKVMSLLAALFLPATLISSVFGMNFRDIPTLSWHYGFLFAIGIMLVTVVALVALFRWRRWM